MMSLTDRNTDPDQQTPNPEDLASGVPLDDFLPYLLNRITNRLNINLLGDLRPLKITTARWRVLAILHTGDNRSIGELAAYTAIDPSTLSRVIDQMERDGLVSRRQSTNDSRRVKIHISSEGVAMFNVILPKALRHYEQAIDGLTETDRRTLVMLLHRVLDNIRTTPYA